MAASGEKFRPMEVFWTCEEQPDVESFGNQRPLKVKAAVKGKKIKEVKANVPKKQPTVQKLPQPQAIASSESFETTPSLTSTTTSKASLKDLCEDDKQRVINLIKELARLGEEKENVRDQMKKERKQFESELQRVLKQQERILQERTVVQGQLEECQAMIKSYQELADEQAKQSARELAAAKQQIEKEEGRCKAEMYTPPKKALSTQQVQTEPFELNPVDNFDDSASLASSHAPNHAPAPPPPRLRLPTHLASSHDRPFSNMIDKLIEDERSRPPPAPIEFKPLQPDTDVTDGESTTGVGGVGGGAKLERMSDEQFVEYYKQLSPFERKQQLQVQKAALLEEQTFLKNLLAQQEKLLTAKQQQLHMQHELQQQRLSYFERTGNFPQHDPRIELPSLEHNNPRIEMAGLEQEPYAYAPQQAQFGHGQQNGIHRMMHANGHQQNPHQQNPHHHGESGYYPSHPHPPPHPPHPSTVQEHLVPPGRPVPTFYHTQEEEEQRQHLARQQPQQHHQPPQPHHQPHYQYHHTATQPEQPEWEQERAYEDDYLPTMEEPEGLSNQFCPRQAADLLDLVDEVESLHSQPPCDPPPSRLPYQSHRHSKPPYQPEVPPHRTSDPTHPPYRTSDPSNPPYRTSDPSNPPYRTSDPSNPPYRTSDPSNPPYRTSDPSNPPYRTSDPSNPPYRTSDPSNPPYGTSEPARKSRRPYKTFEPEPRPETWRRRFETDTETETEPGLPSSRSTSGTEATSVSASASASYAPSFSPSAEIDDLLRVTREFMGREEDEKKERKRVASAVKSHRVREKQREKERERARRKGKRKEEPPPSEVDAELEESQVLEDVFFVK